MTASTRLPKHLRANAQALQFLLATFQRVRLETYLELMPLNGKLLRWTKPGDDCFLIPSPGFVANDLGQLARVKRDIRHHFAEMAYESVEMEENFRLAQSRVQRQAPGKGKLTAPNPVAAGLAFCADPDKRAGFIRDCSVTTQRAKQLLQLLDVQQEG